MKEKQYFPTINLLRGVAALLVCLYHFSNFSDFRGYFLAESEWMISIGKLGVQGVFVFFVITGFVIPLSMFQNDFTLNRLTKFLSKRWVRIEIPYIASIAATFILWAVLSIIDKRVVEIIPAQLLHHITYTIAFTDYEWYNSIYWTLAIEFQFYILIALVFPLLISPNVITKTTSLVVLCIIPLFFPDNRIVFEYMPIFGMGIVLFWLKTKQTKDFIAYPLFAVLLTCIFFVHDLEITITALITTAIIGFFHWDFKFFNWLGNISYSLYLTHGMVGGTIIYVFWGYAQTFNRKLLLAGIAVMVSLLAASLFWRLIEKPSKKLAKKIGSR